MALFKRLLSTLRADAHGVVDALEDRTLMLRHHLREAETAVQAKQARVASLDAEEKRARGERERIAQESVEVDRDVELALCQDAPDLARYAVKQLLPLRQLVTRIDARLKAIDEERRDLNQALADQQTALDALRSRVHAALAAETTLGAEGGLAVETRAASDEQVELELLRRQQSRAKGGAQGGSHEES